MAGFGLLILGPAQHMWFNFAGRILPKRDTVTTLKKLMMGQLSYGPLMTAVFFIYNAALQGKTNSCFSFSRKITGVKLKRCIILSLLLLLYNY